MLRKKAPKRDSGTRSRVSKKPWKSREHLNRVKEQPCLMRLFWNCGGPMDPHHCRKLKPAGLMPRHDYLAVPLCRKHHEMMFGDERLFWETHDIDPRDFIARFSAEGKAAIEALGGRTVPR